MDPETGNHHVPAVPQSIARFIELGSTRMAFGQGDTKHLQCLTHLP
jgi:hypothetical protein